MCFDGDCREHLILWGHFFFLLLSLFVLIGMFG
jgi:hypothetical protein